MNPLTWLGLTKRDAHPHLAAIHRVVQRLLPDDEAVVHRYIVVVSLLLTRMAQADGVFLQCELNQLERLFRHIDRMPPEGIAELSNTLNAQAAEVTEDELAVAFRELKTLCDADERRQVIRLLGSMASADGEIADMERRALIDIGAALDIPAQEIEALARQDEG